ncbi:amino acid adenylation domain-containing protein [Nocardia sp. NBC_01499]|uniref:non-ribosomal peptide synthetase/MFS transporter n=1 Tax=Nocardia sp. NBC_01499 TaxID=2903597 RepID=UPI003870729B
MGIARTAEQHTSRRDSGGSATDPFRAVLAHARSNPTATAVIAGTRSLSYQDLATEMTGLLAVLQRAGVRDGDLVGLCMARGHTAIVGMLAVSGAGAGYLPLDPGYPAARLAGMLEDARPRVVLVEADATLPELPADTVVLPVPADLLAAEAAPVDPGPAAPAYVIFTSGSTGRPKGVVVPRRALAHFCAAAARRYRIGPGDRLLQFAPLTFDVSVEEIFVPLSVGATVVVRDDEMISRPDLFLAQCSALGITVLDLPTSYWVELVGAIDRGEAELPSSVRLVIIGGEAASVAAVRRWHACVGDAVTLLNAYGPTECTVSVTVADLTHVSDEDTVPIGLPLAGVRCEVVDADGVPVLDGESGELVIGGSLVATGYLNRPSLTAQRFPTSPDGTRRYRTGDRVRRRDDGQFDYLGRLDQQVKIRGFRVEPGEIEAALCRLAGVIDAVVLVEQRGDRPVLVAHLLSDNGKASIEDVRRGLAAELPAHMVPAVFVAHASFPTTRQGKVDRDALASGSPGEAVRDVRVVGSPGEVDRDVRVVGSPGEADREALAAGSQGGVDHDALATDSMPQHRPTIPSADPVAAGVIALWRNLFGGNVIDDEDFFSAGGDSLLAIRLLAALHREFGTELTLGQFYTAPTRSALVDAVRNSADAPPTPLDAQVPTPRVVDMSPLQREFWIGTQLAADQPVHILGIRYSWTGSVRPELLRAALAVLTDRHPMLRARVPSPEHPRFVIEPTATIPVDEHDLRALAPADRAEQAERLRAQAMRTPFDLTVAPLARIILLRNGIDDELVLIVNHVVFDGWSVGVFGTELAAIYRDLDAGITPATSPKPLPERPEPGPSLAEYWHERLAGADLDATPPTDRPRPPTRTFDTARAIRPIDPSLVDEWQRFAQEHRAGLFVVLLAGLRAVLYRYTGKQDITVLTPVARRASAALEQHIGMAINVLPMRGTVGGASTFAELTVQASRSVIADLEHGDLALHEIVTAADRRNLANADDLTPVVLIMHNAPSSTDSTLRYTGDLPAEVALDHLTIGFDSWATGPTLTADYATDLYDRERIEALLTHLQTLLEAAVRAPHTAVAQLPMLTAAEKHRVVHAWNDTAIELPEATAIHQLFEQVVAAHPDAPALTHLDATISYRELNTRANRLARLLRARGVGPGTRAAICLDRGFELFTAMWAVLKAGGAYVPLDPAYPADRLGYMLADSRAATLITRLDLAAAPPVSDEVTVVALDRDAAEIAGLDDTDLDQLAIRDDPAYVMYTSGSTGRAKGAIVDNGNLVHAVRMWQRAYGVQPFWTHQQQASFSFDMFVCETFRALCTGGRLVLVPREVLLDPAEFLALMRTERVECTELVPAVLRMLLEHAESVAERLDFLRLLICGGEKWHVREYQRAQRLVGPTGRVVNAYGVTEGTADSTYFDGNVDHLPPDAPLPIGRPFPNCRVYVLDENGQPVPPGIVGELYLAGLGIGQGYFDRPALTAERFLDDPFVGAPARMYRSGDAARFRRDGTVEFLGRRDDQVQVNGYRVELGEVEAALAALPDVMACAADARTLPSGFTYLVAYVVLRAGAEATEPAMRDALAATLPTHMIPSRVVTLSALPLSPNGKLHRAALPDPAHPDHEVGARPRTPTERRIAAVWAEVLGVEEIGVDDNFFALGGDSFTALRLVRRITPTPALIELYRQPTVRGLASLLDERAVGTVDEDRDLLQQLTAANAPTTDGVTVVAVPYSGGSAIAYQPLAAALPAQYALYAVELPGHDRTRPDEPHRSATEVAAKVVAELTAIPGPVLLYGHCLSVAITVEIARQAEASGIDLVAVGLGAGFPTARLSGRLFDWLHRFQRFTSDRHYVEYLRGRGGFTDIDDPEELAFVVRNVRHDERDAEDYFAAAYRGPAPIPLRAPVISVIGEHDRVTDYYRERYREWEHFATDVELVVLPEAGHFFVKSHAEDLARILVAHATQKPEPHPDGPLLPESSAPAASAAATSFAVVSASATTVSVGSAIAASVPVVSDAAASAAVAPVAAVSVAAAPVSAASVLALPVSAAPVAAPSAAVGSGPDASVAAASSIATSPAISPPKRRYDPGPDLRRFGIVTFGQLVSMIGSGLSSLALSIWVYQLTGSLTQFAVIAAAALLPGILISPFAGAAADRWDRRRTMLAADLTAAVAMGTVATLVYFGGPALWQVYLAVSVTSLAGAFQRPAYLASVSQLVPKRYLGHTTGLTQLGVSLGQVVAPLLGAALLAPIGLSGVLWVDVSTFCVGVLTLVVVRFPDRMARRRDEPLIVELTAGWRYLTRRPGLRTALRFFVVDHACYALGFAVITPMLLIEHSALVLGAALTAGGIGGLTASLLMSVWGGTSRRVNGMLACMGLSSLGMCALGAGGSSLAIAGMFLLVFGEVLAEAHWIAVVQNKVGFELQGRVLSVFITVMMLTMPLGYLVVGPLAERYVQPLLEPQGALADSLGPLLGTGPGRALALLVLLSGFLQLAWVARGWANPTLRLLEDDLPDALPPARLTDRDTLQRRADTLLESAVPKSDSRTVTSSTR